MADHPGSISAGPATAGLFSPAGQELLARLAGLEIGPERALALSAALRAEFPAELIAPALTQRALRMAAREKFAAADQMLFTRAGLEQASSELTAGHAAARLTGGQSEAGSGPVADLCCGIGGNTIALAASASDTPRPAAATGPGGTSEPSEAAGAARASGAAGTARASGAAEAARADGAARAAGTDGTGGAAGAGGRRVLAVDADLTSLAYARHNVAVCAPGTDVGFACADVTELPLRGLGAIFIDPARRDARGRLPAGQYRPPLGWCLDLAAQVPQVGIKAAPGLDRDRVPPGWELEFVAVGRELKEALLWSPALATAARRATVLPAGATLTAQRPGNPPDSAGNGQPHLVPQAPPGGYLFDPNPAVTRAGLVTDLARLIGAWQIDPMIAFLSSDEPVRTPFARTLRVLESAPWHEKRFAARLRELGIGSADIRRRGLAGDVELIRRRLSLRGDRARVIILTRVADRPWGLICEPLPG